MRLIDADALIQHLQKDPLFELVEQYGITSVIEVQPTVDAVPVIRCKDCIYKNEYGCCTLYINFHHLTADMDYCSDGERKEE